MKPLSAVTAPIVARLADERAGRIDSLEVATRRAIDETNALLDRLNAGLPVPQAKQGLPMKTAADRVRQLIADHLGVEIEKATPEASFIDDLGGDSLDHVELVMAMEEEFGVEISDEAAESIHTVGDAIKLIERKAVPA